MEKSIEIKAATKEIALAQALSELNATEDQVTVEVLQKGGVFSQTHIKVTLSESANDKVQDFVNNLLCKMNMASTAVLKTTDEGICITIDGPDSANAIGYRGEVLDALQYLTITYINQEKFDIKKVVVDAENYREKRRETLVGLANRLAEKAHRTARVVELEPMNPFERRIIHAALHDSEIAETKSEGEDQQRHIVIVPKGVEIRTDRRPNGNNRGGRNNDRRDRRQGGNGRDNARKPRENFDRAPKAYIDENEAPDGRQFLGYFTEDDGFQKQEIKRNGPPKMKSFGGKKKF